MRAALFLGVDRSNLYKITSAKRDECQLCTAALYENVIYTNIYMSKEKPSFQVLYIYNTDYIDEGVMKNMDT